MLHAQIKAKKLLDQMAAIGLTPEVAIAIKGLLTELEDSIQEGRREYGANNISTSESSCYESAVLAKNDLVKAFRKKLAEWHHVIQLLGDIV